MGNVQRAVTTIQAALGGRVLMDGTPLRKSHEAQQRGLNESYAQDPYGLHRLEPPKGIYRFLYWLSERGLVFRIGTPRSPESTYRAGPEKEGPSDPRTEIPIM